MNRNRYKKVVAIATATSVAVGSLTGCQSSTDTVSKTKTEASNEVSTKKDASSQKSVQDGVEKKTETVFAKADALGTVNEVTVSSWLKNGKGDATISDITDLTDIKNVKGEEAFNLNGTSLDWTANGSDIYYQGKSSKTLPVNVKVTYTLDGAEISPEELAGKSGHVKMHFDYANNQKMTIKVNGKDQEVNVPFAIMTGTILDNEKFANITVTNGQVINDGNRSIVAALALPGLKDTLLEDIEGKIKDMADDLEIPESVDIEADVTNFQVDMTLSVVLNDFFNNLDIDKFTGVDDMKELVKKMQDNFKLIVDGSAGLDDGLGKLQSGLKDGADKLTNGANQLEDGTRLIADGTGELVKNNDKLNSGAYSLFKGLQKAEPGSKKLAKGLEKLSAGATKLDKGVDSLLTSKDKLPKLKAGTNQLVAGISTPQKGQKYSLLDGSKLLAEKTTGMDKQMDTVMAKVKGQLPGYLEEELTAENIAAVKKAVRSAIDDKYIAETEQKITDKVVAIFDQQAEAMLAPNKKAIAQAVGVAELTPETLKAVEGQLTNAIVSEATPVETRKELVNKLCLVEQYKGAETAVQGIRGTLQKGLSAEMKGVIKTELETEIMKQLQGEMGTKLEKALEPVAATVANNVKNKVLGIKEVKDMMEDVSSLESNCKALAGGIEQLYAGSKQLQAGVVTLEDGIKKEMKPGTKQLADGANEANTGSATLYSGVQQLYSGSNLLQQGLISYTDGVAAVDGGANRLLSGIHKLQKGVKGLSEGDDSALAGVAKLKDGSNRLRKGTEKFEDQAINKISDVVNKNFDQVKDRLTAVVKAGQSYNSFSGLNSDMTGSVRFVIETAAIGDSDK